MTERDELHILAGEYVLGTLDLAERQAVAARRQREPELDRAIVAWEARLSPLDDGAAAVEPPADLWRGIDKALDALAAPPAVAELRRSLRRWKFVAVTASAIAATSLLFVAARTTLTPAQPQRFVAVLQQDADSPAFLVSVDVASRQLTVRPVNAVQPRGKSYELWLVNDRYDGPRSLGLIDNAAFTTRETLAAYPPDVVRSSVLAVSLEPEGGSTTGRPTGPVVFSGRLVQAAP